MIGTTKPKTGTEIAAGNKARDAAASKALRKILEDAFAPMYAREQRLLEELKQKP